MVVMNGSQWCKLYFARSPSFIASCSFVLCAAYLGGYVSAGEGNMEKHLFPFADAESWGFADNQGEVVVEPRFTWADDFYNGVARVRTKEHEAYLTTDGKVLFSVGIAQGGGRFDLLQFSCDRGWFRQAEKWGCIDRSGIVIIEPQYDDVAPFNEGMAPVNVGKRVDNSGPDLATIPGRWGAIDIRGSVLIPITYEAVTAFADDRCWVLSEDGLWICVDVTGSRQFVLWRAPTTDGQYVAHVSSFSNGFARVCIDGTLGRGCGLIGVDGQWGLLPVVEAVGRFSEGLAEYKDRESGEWGYLDVNGSRAVRPQFREAARFSDGLARVRLGESLCFIDRSGNVVFDLVRGAENCAGRAMKINDAGEFRYGLARVHVGGNSVEEDGLLSWRGGAWYYVNRRGVVVRTYKRDIE